MNTGQARLLVGLYLDLSAPGNAEVVALAVELLGIAALYQVVDGIQVANNGALQGLKDTRVPMGIDLLTFWGIGKSSGELAHMERFFGRLRQKLARYVRRMRAASESERTGHLTTKLFVEWYNETVT